MVTYWYYDMADVKMATCRCLGSQFSETGSNILLLTMWPCWPLAFLRATHTCLPRFLDVDHFQRLFYIIYTLHIYTYIYIDILYYIYILIYVLHITRLPLAIPLPHVELKGFRATISTPRAVSCCCKAQQDSWL